jgi:tetratricopeptide (TPR) repeat protein
MEDYTKAANYFAQARTIAPANIDNLLNLSFAYYEMQDYAKALEVTQQALAMDPGNIDTLQNARDVSFMAGEKDLTVQYLKQLIERRSNDGDFAEICRILYEQEKYEELITYAQKWYQWDNSNQDSVQFIILGASQTGNEALKTTFSKILQAQKK